MAEPITTTLLVGAAGAATKELVNKAWDSGKKWLSTYFENHQAEAQAAANANAEDFLSELAQKVDEVERQSAQNKAVIDAAFKEPSFSVLLQKAIINSAQTSDKGKHQLLSKLVAEKLQVKAESTQSLASQMACDAITYVTEKQLKLLGLTFCLLYRTPVIQMPPIFTASTDSPAMGLTQETIMGAFNSFANIYFEPMLIDDYSNIDLLHLESLSCLKVVSIIRSNSIFSQWSVNGHRYNEAEFFRTTVGSKIKLLWDKGLGNVSLTSVGMLVGLYVADTISKGTTSLGVEWTT